MRRNNIKLLKEIIKFEYHKICAKKNPGIVIAFSGGIDSTLLAYYTRETLKDANITLVSLSTEFVSKSEKEFAEKAGHLLGLNHVTLNASVMSNSKILQNDERRCYYCKKIIMKEIKSIAKKIYDNYIIFDGSNYSDLFDNRAGKKALDEEKIITPLRDAELIKSEIIDIAREKIPWHHAKSESCIATRIPFNNRITKVLLKKIEESENILKDKRIPYIQFRTVKNNDKKDVAMIRIKKDKKAKITQPIINRIKEIGFENVEVDLL